MAITESVMVWERVWPSLGSWVVESAGLAPFEPLEMSFPLERRVLLEGAGGKATRHTKNSAALREPLKESLTCHRLELRFICAGERAWSLVGDGYRH